MSGDGTGTVPLPEPAYKYTPDDWRRPQQDYWSRAQVEQYGRDCAKAGAEGERVAVVAWLDRQLEVASQHRTPGTRLLRGMRDAIERGEHL